jgi:uncharacterized DUF497 family protein
MNSGREDLNENSFDGIEFEWYPLKAAANLKKHQVSFDEAMTIFGDKMHVVFPDREHSYDEERFLAIGNSNLGRLIVLCFTERYPKLRLISARLAEAWERREYEIANE